MEVGAAFAVAAIAVGLIVLEAKHSMEVQAAAAREAAFRAANGWSFAEVGADLLKGYDRNKDGRLTLDVVNGVQAIGELTHVSRSTHRQTAVLGVPLPTGANYTMATDVTWSIAPLVKGGDTDHDGLVSQAELLAVLRSYDANKDGRLSNVERADALAHEVKVSSEQKLVGIQLPPAPAPARTPAPQNSASVH